MRVISRRPVNTAAGVYLNDSDAIARTYKVLRSGEFKTPEQLRKIFPSLDNFKYRDKWWVLDIGGNNLRLIAFIDFRFQCLCVKHVVPHAEYDKLCKRYRAKGD